MTRPYKKTSSQYFEEIKPLLVKWAINRVSVKVMAIKLDMKHSTLANMMSRNNFGVVNIRYQHKRDNPDIDHAKINRELNLRIEGLEAKLTREYQVVAGNDIRIANMGERIAELEDKVKYYEQKELTTKADKRRKQAEG